MSVSVVVGTNGPTDNSPKRLTTASQTRIPSDAGFLGNGMERDTGFEPATSTLARLHSTTELVPPETDPVDRTLCVTSQAHIARVEAPRGLSSGSFELKPRGFTYLGAGVLYGVSIGRGPSFRGALTTIRRSR